MEETILMEEVTDEKLRQLAERARGIKAAVQALNEHLQTLNSQAIQTKLSILNDLSKEAGAIMSILSPNLYFEDLAIREAVMSLYLKNIVLLDKITLMRAEILDSLK